MINQWFIQQKLVVALRKKVLVDQKWPVIHSALVQLAKTHH